MRAVLDFGIQEKPEINILEITKDAVFKNCWIKRTLEHKGEIPWEAWEAKGIGKDFDPWYLLLLGSISSGSQHTTKISSNQCLLSHFCLPHSEPGTQLQGFIRNDSCPPEANKTQ